MENIHYLVSISYDKHLILKVKFGIRALLGPSKLNMNVPLIQIALVVFTASIFGAMNSSTKVVTGTLRQHQNF